MLIKLKTKVEQLLKKGYLEGELAVNPYWYILWQPDEIEQHNFEYEIAEYTPGFWAFGSNGGGELFVFDADGAISLMPMIGMEPAAAVSFAGDFDEFERILEKSASSKL